MTGTHVVPDFVKAGIVINGIEERGSTLARRSSRRSSILSRSEDRSEEEEDPSESKTEETKCFVCWKLGHRKSECRELGTDNTIRANNITCSPFLLRN